MNERKKSYGEAPPARGAVLRRPDDWLTISRRMGEDSGLESSGRTTGDGATGTREARTGTLSRGAEQKGCSDGGRGGTPEAKAPGGALEKL